MILNLNIATSDPEIRSLISKYWQLNSENNFAFKVKDICKENNITRPKLLLIINTNSTAYLKSFLCTQCSNPYEIKNRSHFQQLVNKDFKTELCYNCQKEIEKKKNEEAKQNLINAKQKMVYGFEKYGGDVVDIQKLTLKEAVNLLSVFNIMASDDFSTLSELRHSTNLLTPGKHFDFAVINGLHKSNLLLIHPNNDVRFFEFMGSDYINEFYQEIIWTVPSPNKSFYYLKKELENIFKDDSWMDLWLDEYIELWKTIGKWECYDRLTLSLEKFNFRYPKFLMGNKIMENILYALDHFSIYEANYLIFLSVKNAAAYSRTNRFAAENSIPNEIVRKVDRALVEQWKIPEYRRIPIEDLSAVTFTLFYKVLKLGMDGFTSKIG